MDGGGGGSGEVTDALNEGGRYGRGSAEERAGGQSREEGSTFLMVVPSNTLAAAEA